MNDDEVLDAVKKTLAGVWMDRPVEAIEERGQVRRRNRRLFGFVAGGGLAAVAALALAVPMANHQTGQVAGASAASTASTTTEVKQAAFTVAKQSDGTVKVTLFGRRGVPDPDALQKGLADAGIPSVVKVGVICKPQRMELSGLAQVVQIVHQNYDIDLLITPSKMPADSRLYFSFLGSQPDGGWDKGGEAAWFLVSNEDPMNCRSIG